MIIRTLILLILSSMFIVACTRNERKDAISTDTIDSTAIYDSLYGDPDPKDMRKQYVRDYAKSYKLDTTFRDVFGKPVHVLTNYYCLFDSAVTIPGRYVWEDTTKTFTTHNYAHDITIVRDHDTIFKRTITKADFADLVNPEWRSYSVLFDPPNFEYDTAKAVYRFGYSLTIPITDLGEGWSLLIDNNGRMTKTDK